MWGNFEIQRIVGNRFSCYIEERAMLELLDGFFGWIRHAKPSPFMAMGFVAVPALALASFPVQEKVKGQAFFFFIWSLLSLPLNIGLHVAGAILKFRVSPLAGAGFVIVSGLLFQTLHRDRAASKVMLRHTSLLTYGLLCAPLAFIFLVYAWKKWDGYYLFQGLILSGLGIPLILQDVLPKSAQKKFERQLEYLRLRLRILLLFAVALLIACNAAGMLALLEKETLFWIFMILLAGAASAIFLISSRFLESLNARLPSFSISLGGSSGGASRSGQSGGGGSSGGGGAGGKW